MLFVEKPYSPSGGGISWCVMVLSVYLSILLSVGFQELGLLLLTALLAVEV